MYIVQDEAVVKKIDLFVSQQKGIVQTSGSKRTHEQSSRAGVFESTREVVPQGYSGSATHITEIDTAADRDARAILERNLKLNQDGVLDAEPNIYHGLTAHKSFIKKNSDSIGANKFTGLVILMLLNSCR